MDIGFYIEIGVWPLLKSLNKAFGSRTSQLVCPERLLAVKPTLEHVSLGYSTLAWLLEQCFLHGSFDCR